MNKTQIQNGVKKLKGLISLEIECLVHSDFNDTLLNLCIENNWICESDCSIEYLGLDRDYYTPREIKICKYPLNNYEKLFKDLKPLLDIIKVNRSCGLHIHISFKNNVNYYKLLKWLFVENFQKEYLNTFKTIIERDRKTNRFSKFYEDINDFNFVTEQQLKTPYKVRDRYKSINFNSFNIHHTIEFRIFAGCNKITKFKENYFFLMGSVLEGLKNNLDLGCFEVEVNPKKPKLSRTIKEIIKVEVTI